jgi:hypothetical protein
MPAGQADMMDYEYEEIVPGFDAYAFTDCLFRFEDGERAEGSGIGDRSGNLSSEL